MTSVLLFHPPLLLESGGEDPAKNFPITLRVLSSKCDKTELYRLRYRAFLTAGWIKEDAKGEFVDQYDHIASSFSIGAFHNDKCIGSLRLAFGGAGALPKSMPCEVPFGDEILSLAASGHRRFIEFSRMAVEPELTNNSFRTTLYGSLVRAGFISSYAGGADMALIAVHEKFSPFYQRMCGFRVLGASQSYADIREPTHLLGREMNALDDHRRQRNTFFEFSRDEVESARCVLSAAQCVAAA